MIYSHKYVNVLQIIIKDIKLEKPRCFVLLKELTISFHLDLKSSHKTTEIFHS